MVAAERGLGNIIIVAQRRGPREHIYLVLVVIVLIAYLTDKFWAVLSRFLFPTRRPDEHAPKPAAVGRAPRSEAAAGRGRRDSVAPVIEFRDVAKVFNPGTPREYKALEHLSFCIDDLPGQGEFITILGPSGCGKSTALNLLAGFQEVWPPTAGEILVRAQPVVAPGWTGAWSFRSTAPSPTSPCGRTSASAWN